MSAAGRVCVYCEREVESTSRCCPNCGGAKFAEAAPTPELKVTSLESVCLTYCVVASFLLIFATVIFGVSVLARDPGRGLLILVLGTPFSIGQFVVFRLADHYLKSSKAKPVAR